MFVEARCNGYIVISTQERRNTVINNHNKQEESETKRDRKREREKDIVRFITLIVIIHWTNIVNINIDITILRCCKSCFFHLILHLLCLIHSLNQLVSWELQLLQLKSSNCYGCFIPRFDSYFTRFLGHLRNTTMLLMISNLLDLF